MTRNPEQGDDTDDDFTGGNRDNRGVLFGNGRVVGKRPRGEGGIRKGHL